MIRGSTSTAACYITKRSGIETVYVNIIIYPSKTERPVCSQPMAVSPIVIKDVGYLKPLEEAQDKVFVRYHLMNDTIAVYSAQDKLV